MKMQRYKFQALVRLARTSDIAPGTTAAGAVPELPSGQMRRMVSGASTCWPGHAPAHSFSRSASCLALTCA